MRKITHYERDHALIMREITLFILCILIITLTGPFQAVTSAASQLQKSDHSSEVIKSMFLQKYRTTAS